MSPSASAESFGTRLRALRRAAGLTQEELARRSGLSTNGVSALERGARTNPYPHTIRALARALGLDSAGHRELVNAAANTSAVRTAATSAAAPVPSGLPAAPPTPLIGRERELADLQHLLLDSKARLITLTGPGGVGKTSLATEAARRVADFGSFVDGVVFIPLATVRVADAVMPAIAAATGASDTAASAAATLASHLRDRNTLLVLDNLEQVLGMAPAIADLLADCPQVSVLATSRAPLQVRGEFERQVPPLPLPPTESTGIRAVLESASGRLFVDRARAAVPAFSLTEDKAADVAAICRRLGGLPLAIELAAPKLRHLDPATLNARLDHALAGAVARDLPDRQRTMQATLDWSYALLDTRQQQLLDLLGVFSGGFDIEAIEAVAADQVADPLGALEGLVLQSLVSVRRASGGATPLTYHLLEPVRDYARARLRERPAVETVAVQRHRAHFLALAELAASNFYGPDQVFWLQRTEWEAPNISVAISTALSDGDGETAARLCWAMWTAWWTSGRVREGRAFAAEALTLPLTPARRVRAHLVLASMSFAQGDIDAARHNWAAALDLAESTQDQIGVGYGVAGLGLVDLATGRTSDARARFLAASDAGDRWIEALCHIWIGTTLMAEGDPRTAVAHIERGLQSAREREDRLVAYIALFNLAEASIALGRPDRAEEMLLEGTALSGEAGDRANLAFYLDTLGVVASGRGDAKRAARLFGAAAAMRDSAGAIVYRYYLPDEERRARADAETRQSLGPTAYQAEYAEGRACDLREAVELAIGQ